MSVAGLFFCLPGNFPFQGRSNDHSISALPGVKNTLNRIDFIGAILLLIATTLLVAALQKASQEFV